MKRPEPSPENGRALAEKLADIAVDLPDGLAFVAFIVADMGGGTFEEHRRRDARAGAVRADLAALARALRRRRSRRSRRPAVRRMIVPPVRVIVCGGRNFKDREAVFAKLDELAADLGPLFVIDGGAQGVDRWAREWRQDRLHPGKTFHAEWDRYSKAAGPKRNVRMIVEGQPKLVLAFPGGKGTANMIAEAEARFVPVERVT